jgi:hypothetical protein
MKKSLKKLTLHRETLHTLTLRRALGGVDDGIFYTGCGSECSACGRVCEPAGPIEEVEQPVLTC